MKETLCLAEALLVRGRRLQQTGQIAQAQACFRRLLDFAGDDSALAAEAHLRLGETHLKRRHVGAARRHLVASLRCRPGSARAHFLLGLALSLAGPTEDLPRALRHLRRSLRLAPAQVRCRGEAGLLAVRLGRDDEGLALLRRAVEMAPADAGAVGRLVKGLCACGQFEEALAEVRTALFRSPRCSRLRKLWTDLQLAALRRDRDLGAAADDEADGAGPRILPFLRPVGYDEDTEARVRRDDPAALPGPHLVRLRAARRLRRAP